MQVRGDIMDNSILEYKGYHTRVIFDSDDFVLRGKIEGITDLVDFECSSIDDVEKEFHAAVDEYLDFCNKVGKKPEREYKGTFNVRISPELHKKLALAAYKNGGTLNAAVEKAVKEYVLKEDKEKTDTMKDDFDSKKNLLGAVV